MRLDRPTLAAVVAGALAIWSVGSLVDFLQRRVRRDLDVENPRPDRDWIPLVDERYRELASALPMGVVGYASDFSDPSNEFDLFRTQYELAPRIVVRGEKTALVIGKFATEAALRDACAREGLSVAKDLGGGLYLLRRP